MRRRFYWGLMVFLLAACSAKNEPPKGVLPADRMKEVFWDILRVQNLGKELEMQDTTGSKVDLWKLNRKVFEVHGIDSATYESSYAWYVRHPDIFKGLVDSLYAEKQRETNRGYLEETAPPAEDTPLSQEP